MKEIPYAVGMDFGIGLNLLTGEPLQEGVTGNITTVRTARGQTVESKLLRVDRLSTLHKSLGIDIEASGGYMTFSADAKVSFADSCSFNEFSTYVLISIRAQDAFERLDDPVLTEEALTLLRNNRTDRFRERFGDAFISGIGKGGEYFAVFQISGAKEEEKEDLAVSVNAAFQGLLGSAELSTRINTKIQESSSYLDVKVFTFQRGGEDTSQDQTIEQILNKARMFAPSVAGEFAVPYTVLPMSYRTLNLPDDSQQFVDIENQREVIRKNWQVRNQLLVLRNNIEYILFSLANSRDEFEKADSEQLTEWYDKLSERIEAITRSTSKCARNPEDCRLARFDISNITLPKQKKVIIVPNFYGVFPESAKEQIRALGLVYSISYGDVVENVPTEGTIGWQDPPAGTMIAPGSTVQLTIQRTAR